MIGADTNLLVRFIVRDDAEQAALFDQLLVQCEAGGHPIRINQVVLVELVWVLQSAYAMVRPEIASILEQVILARQFDVEEGQQVWRAVKLYQSSSAGFADCLIAIKNTDDGCRATFTLDRVASRLPGMRMLDKLGLQSEPWFVDSP